MDKRFVIKKVSGGHTHIEVQVPPHEALIETYLNHMYPKDAKVYVVHKEKVPDMLWRSAFDDVDENGDIEIDMGEAKKIFMRELRHKRLRSLIQLDRFYCKAIDNDNKEKAQKIEIKKQELRDFPTRFDLSKAKSIADLEALWPEADLGKLYE